ncbi:MAG: SAF domain-containing protein, partial [Dermatophilaceae bacterium]
MLTSAKRLTGAAGPDAAAAIASAPAPKVAAAPRQLQTRWLIGVVAVVLLGGVLLLYAVPSYAGHTAVVVMARDVKVGAILTAEDLGTADVSVGEAVAVVHPADGVLGKTALTDLPAGSLLSPRLVGDAPALPAGQVLVPARLTLGQRPQQGLSFGQVVLAVPAPADPASPGSAALLAASPIRATVVSCGEPDPANGDVVVDLRVPQGEAVGLARAAATGSLTLVVL